MPRLVRAGLVSVVVVLFPILSTEDEEEEEEEEDHRRVPLRTRRRGSRRVRGSARKFEGGPAPCARAVPCRAVDAFPEPRKTTTC